MVMKRSCQLVSQPYFFLHSGFIKYNLMRTMQQQEEWLRQQDGAPVRCKVVPQFVNAFSWFVSPISLGFMEAISILTMVYKPTYNWWGHHLVDGFWKRESPSRNGWFNFSWPYGKPHVVLHLPGDFRGRSSSESFLWLEIRARIFTSPVAFFGGMIVLFCICLVRSW